MNSSSASRCSKGSCRDGGRRGCKRRRPPPMGVRRLPFVSWAVQAPRRGDSIRLSVEPFILWEEGDFRHFLNALPAMCAIIASGHEPRVARMVLIVLERMALYLEEHPDAVEHIAANCTLFDEELIEFLNAKVRQQVTIWPRCSTHFLFSSQFRRSGESFALEAS